MSILPISDEELAGIRSDFNSRMTDTAHRIRLATQYDGEGGIEPTGADENILEIACRLQMKDTRPGIGVRRNQEAEREVESTQWLLIVPIGSDIQVGDRIILLDSAGQTRDDDYTVMGATKEGTQRFQDVWLLKRVR